MIHQYCHNVISCYLCFTCLCNYSPCHFPTDDLVFGSGNKMRVDHNLTKADEVQRQCTLEDEKLDVSNGHWIRYDYPNSTECGEFEYESNPGSWKDLRTKYDGSRPHCWWRDDITKLTTSCVESGCKCLLCRLLFSTACEHTHTD